MFFFRFLVDVGVMLAFPLGLGLLIWLIVRPTPERDAAAARAWADFHTFTVTNGWQLLYVDVVQEIWPNGSKAYVSIYDDAESGLHDSWFWWHHVEAKTIVAVNRIGEGWGSHTGQDGVLYIGDKYAHRSGVQATFSAGELARAQRHWQASVYGPARVVHHR